MTQITITIPATSAHCNDCPLRQWEYAHQDRGWRCAAPGFGGELSRDGNGASLRREGCKAAEQPTTLVPLRLRDAIKARFLR